MDNFGESVLTYALYLHTGGSTRLETIKYLIQNSKELGISLNHVNSERKSVLQLALETENKEIISELLSQSSLIVPGTLTHELFDFCKSDKNLTWLFLVRVKDVPDDIRRQFLNANDVQKRLRIELGGVS